MFSKSAILFSALILAGQANLVARNFCNGGDTAIKYCYGSPNGGPQNLDPQDVSNAAISIRSYGRSTTPLRMLTIPGAGENNCTWVELYTNGTVKVVAKHYLFNVTASVLYEDIANTIDGGETPTSESLDASVLECGWKGGQSGVVVNTTRAEYHTPEFIASGAITDGIGIHVIGATSPYK